MVWDRSIRMSGLVALLCLAGCAGQEGETPFGFPFFSNSKPPVADRDACGSPQDCSARLKTLIKNPNREWIGVPQSADGYANGTRLFAYRALRKKLTCDQLQFAVEDTKAAISLLEKPQYERAYALAGEVSREIAAEQIKRCRRTAVQ